MSLLFLLAPLILGDMYGWGEGVKSKSRSESLYLMSSRRMSKSSQALMMRLMKYAVKTQQAILSIWKSPLILALRSLSTVGNAPIGDCNVVGKRRSERLSLTCIKVEHLRRSEIRGDGNRSS